MVGMDEECQKAKEGERMKTKKAKKWFMPNKDGEGFFFVKLAFSSGTQTQWLTGGDRGTEECM